MLQLGDDRAPPAGHQHQADDDEQGPAEAGDGKGVPAHERDRGHSTLQSEGDRDERDAEAEAVDEHEDRAAGRAGAADVAQREHRGQRRAGARRPADAEHDPEQRCPATPMRGSRWMRTSRENSGR